MFKNLNKSTNVATFLMFFNAIFLYETNDRIWMPIRLQVTVLTQIRIQIQIQLNYSDPDGSGSVT